MHQSSDMTAAGLNLAHIYWGLWMARNPQEILFCLFSSLVVEKSSTLVLTE